MKQIFWIVLGVVAVGVVGAYLVIVPGIKSTVEEKKQACLKQVTDIHTIAANSGKEDAIKNPGHVDQVLAYKAELKKQAETIEAALRDKKLDEKFSDAPTGDLQFDGWLNDQRTKISQQASAAGLQLPTDFDHLTFKAESTKDSSADVTHHRAYRLRQLAIIDEVVQILSKKNAKQKVLSKQLDNKQPEASTTVDAGAKAIEKISVIEGKELTERLKQYAEEAKSRVGQAPGPGRNTSTAKAAPELPLALKAEVEIQVIAPLCSVPSIIQSLETSARYFGLVSRVDFQRTANPFPSATDLLPQADPSAAPVTPVAPGVSGVPAGPHYINTHYQEAPVRLLVTLDIYEYDKAKESPFNTTYNLAAAPALPAKK